jgi:protein tyrosine phosphatase
MNTRIDFWQMIWNNNTTIIVSLYADEKLQVNSSDLPDYWPLSNEIIDCENFNVCLVDEYFECEYIYRDCLLRSTKVCKKIFFFKFISLFFYDFKGRL